MSGIQNPIIGFCIPDTGFCNPIKVFYELD